MGNQYIKRVGLWEKVVRPYTRVNNVWTPVKQTWVKRSGTWTLCWAYSATPTSIPEMSLQVVDNRYIRVGTRLPDSSTNPRLRRIRVLGQPDHIPTTQYGSGAIGGNATSFPNEDWSNWYYNGYNPNVPSADHGATNAFTYKAYPLNPNSSTNLPGGKFYYFAAWAEDVDGNWSVGVYERVWMPKNGVAAEHVLHKEANITADAAGSISGTTGVSPYTQGLVKAHNSPRSNGVFFHGTTFNTLVGASGTATVSTARIRLSRSNDTGLSVANVRLGWHNEATTGDMDPSTAQDVTVVGTIQKGETKWFDLPSSWYNKFTAQMKGIVVRYGANAGDDVELYDLGTDVRCGEVNLSWTEDL